jgi:hypothetical protein
LAAKQKLEKVVGGEEGLVGGEEEVDEVMSAKRPKMKQSVEMPKPIMVRNWKCQPYEEL